MGRRILIDSFVLTGMKTGWGVATSVGYVSTIRLYFCNQAWILESRGAVEQRRRLLAYTPILCCHTRFVLKVSV